MSGQTNESWRYDFSTASGKEKTIRVIYGDLCWTTEQYDVAVCSAYKNNYRPLRGTLVGAMDAVLDISVYDLAKSPELDLKAMGCWLSREVGKPFRRIACVELLDLHSRFDQRMCCGTLLKSTFSTLRFVLEQADLKGIPVKRVALPVLGAGSQGIAVSDIAGPLINQCIQALQTVEGLECITFYERDKYKVGELTRVLGELIRPVRPEGDQVFISYHHNREREANLLRQRLEARGLRCWMAPDSIPVGSDYTSEIPFVLNRVKALVLLLTPEAEQSNWVHKEVGIAIGNGKKVVPYQPEEYALGEQFRFLLEGIQILHGWNHDPETAERILADRVCQIVSSNG